MMGALILAAALLTAEEKTYTKQPRGIHGEEVGLGGF
jgi:hypothetical protein